MHTQKKFFKRMCTQKIKKKHMHSQNYFKNPCTHKKVFKTRKYNFEKCIHTIKEKKNAHTYTK